MLKIHQYTALCAPSMAQYAAIEAIENGDAEVQKMLDEYARRRNFVATRFNEIESRAANRREPFMSFPI